MIRTQGLTHIHLVVRDLERSLRFYQGVFGMEERFRDGPKMVFLNTPGSPDLITLNEDPAEVQLAGVIWVRIPALLYGSAIVYSTIVYFVWEFLDEGNRAQANLLAVFVVNIPYTIVVFSCGV